MNRARLTAALALCLAPGLFWTWRVRIDAYGDAVKISERARPFESKFQKQGLRTQNGTSQTAATIGRHQLRSAAREPHDQRHKRPWEPAWLARLAGCAQGDRIRVELVDGQFASGKITGLQRTNGTVISVSAKLSEPEPGLLFVQKQTRRGKAGDWVGVIELPVSRKAYRIEPSGTEGTPELAQRRLDEVVCADLPAPFPSPGGAPQNAPAPMLQPAAYPDVPIPAYQNGITILESLHGATAVIYLDFQGGYTPAWGGVTYERPSVNNAQIRDIWRRVAEDYMPFEINVTTDLAAFQSAPEGSRQRVIITPTTTASPGTGGTAMIGSFNWTQDTPCWVFSPLGNACGQSCSHEAGHTLGLSHSGQEHGGVLHDYYTGHGSGDTGWAPIMGMPFYANVTQWSKGEYLYADSSEDQLEMIVSNNNDVSYRPDDTGDTLETSRYLDIYPDYSASAEGIIEMMEDTDAFQFTTAGGEVWLRADPVNLCPNLALKVALYDESGNLLLSTNPQTTLWAALATNLPPGSYTFRVSGAGRNSPLTNGFSSYASLGYYSITGSVANARLPDRFVVEEHSTNGTVVGVVSQGTTNGDLLSFTITSGNGANAFAIDDSGTLSVVDNSLLDYSSVASKTYYTAQMELFVTIAVTHNAVSTETDRRVVITLTRGAPASAPAIWQQPQCDIIDAGTTILLRASATGAPPLLYQWLKNGENLRGATCDQLSITGNSRRDSGMYAVRVSNSFGAILSSNAVVRVRVPQELGTSERTPDGLLTLVSSDCDGDILEPKDLTNFVIQASHDLINWESLPNQPVLTNALLLFKDIDTANYGARFYRVLEK